MKPGILVLIVICSFLSCTKPSEFNTEQEEMQILKLHHLQRDYHFNKDSIAFAEMFSDRFISINRGKISRPKKQESISRYHGYFSSVNFLKWDDLSDPIIRFSEDGKLAYTIVDKIVKVSYVGADGNSLEGETHFAWTTIYRKYANEWKIDCVTSTERPAN